MLNESFFALAHQSLASFGRLTIVTDNEWYARLLLRTAARLTSSSSSTSTPSSKPLFQCPDLLKMNKKQSKQMKRNNNSNNNDSITGSGSGEVWVLEELGGARVYVGSHPGMLAGHVTSSSSYFDRLWIKEKKTNRYCISLIAL
jgi:hypothetical protein